MSDPAFVITETEPTPILKDFAVFIRYLTTHTISLTKVKEYISSKNLYEINQVMSSPLQNVAPRSNQDLYPLLHLFYHLVLAGKLFHRSSKKGGQWRLEPTERLQLYEKLTYTEKYMFLLETFWVDVDWAKLQQGMFRRSPIYTFHMVWECLGKEPPGVKIELDQNKFKYSTSLSTHWEHFLHYISYFGFWSVIYDEKLAEGKSCSHSIIAKAVTPSRFGITMTSVLNRTRNLIYWNLPSRHQSGGWKAIPGSPLSPVDAAMVQLSGIDLSENKPEVERKNEPFFVPFVSLFPEGELQKTLLREQIKFIDGTYIFKVSLRKNLWRRIEISADHTLLDLHYSIQEAYDFDDDHMYSFFMDGKAWSRESFCTPYGEDGPFVDEDSIGELGILIGQNILYLFDYGAEWRFRVELEEIRTDGPKPENPGIIEWKGKAPKQYDEW